MKKKVSKVNGIIRRLLLLVLCIACLAGMATVQVSATSTDSKDAKATTSADATASQATSSTEKKASQARSSAEEKEGTTKSSAKGTETKVEASAEEKETDTKSSEDTKTEGKGKSSSSASTASLAANTPQTIANDNTFSVTPVLQNMDVVYFAYHSASDVTSSITFTPVTSGNTVVLNNFNSSNQAGYVLFFVKPQDNYLFVGAHGTGNNDVYSIDGDKGNISTYPGISNIVAQAKAKGYVGVLGYMRDVGVYSDMSQIITLKAESPNISVSATADKTTGVKPGDVVTFTVTVTPGQTEKGVGTVEGVTATKITINDKEVSYDDLKKDSSGNYVTTVQYTVTQADCDAGTVELAVDAKVDYSNVLGVSDGQSIGSTATISKSAQTSCQIAPKNRVVYRISYKGDGVDAMTKPDAITKKPDDVINVYKGTTVDVVTDYGTDAVYDTTNSGVWTFDGWYQGDQKVSQVTMGEDTIYLDGTWTFTRKTVALTVSKEVSGNLGDTSKSFSFTVACDGLALEDANFSLKHGESKEITLPMGATVTVTETATDGYSTSYSINDGEKTAGNSVTKTFAYDDTSAKIIFTNEKNGTIDTGFYDNNSPYLLLLTMTLGTAGLFYGYRRKKQK